MSQTSQSVTELFYRYLHRQIAVQAEGLGLVDPDGQVTPYEAVALQPVDPRLAWEDALAVLRCGQRSEVSFTAPPDWPTLVAAQEPALAVAFCIGNYPQMVRNMQPLLERAGNSHRLHSVGLSNQPTILPPALLQWTNTVRGYPQLLVAVGVLRLARRFEEASELLRSNREDAAWQVQRANEEAALTWHRGDAEEALAMWQAQQTSAPVLFNRGMTSLFLGRPAEARTALTQAVAQLPEMSAWHHLGHLYLALIAARS